MAAVSLLGDAVVVAAEVRGGGGAVEGFSLDEGALEVTAVSVEAAEVKTVAAVAAAVVGVVAVLAESVEAASEGLPGDLVEAAVSVDDALPVDLLPLPAGALGLVIWGAGAKEEGEEEEEEEGGGDSGFREESLGSGEGVLRGGERRGGEGRGRREKWRGEKGLLCLSVVLPVTQVTPKAKINNHVMPTLHNPISTRTFLCMTNQ